MDVLSKGQRLPLANIVPTGVLDIGVAVQGLRLDFACFGLDGAGKLSDERYMTFFNQPRTPCGGVEVQAASGGDHAVFAFQLSRLPAGIQRIVVAASIDSSHGGAVMSQMASGYLRLLAGRHEVARFSFGAADFAQERFLFPRCPG